MFSLKMELQTYQNMAVYLTERLTKRAETREAAKRFMEDLEELQRSTIQVAKRMALLKLNVQNRNRHSTKDMNLQQKE